MRCEKCDYENSEYSIICEKCGSPLNIEKNIELQKIYNHKPRVIEIEEIALPEDKEAVFNNTRKKITNVLIVLLFFVVILLFALISNIVRDYRSRDIMNQYDVFIKEKSLGILYFGNDEEASNLLKNYSTLYNFNYLNIDARKITTFKRNHIKDDLNLKKIRSTVVLVENGKTVGWLDDYKYDTKDVMIVFLQNHNVIPNELGNPTEVINKFDEAIVSTNPMIIYYVNTKTERQNINNQELKKLFNDYSIDYTFVEGYYLSDSQNLSLLRKLNYNEIQEELLIIVDEEKIVTIIENVDFEENDYFEIASRYGIIDESSANSLTNVSFNEFKSIISSQSKNIIMLGKADCEYCERIRPIIGKISIQNNLTIYYYQINVKEYSIVDEYLLSIGYTGGKILPPVILITENNKVLDFVVGLSDKNLFESKFRELGVIR